MIERTQSYKVGDKFYPTLQAAQEAEIAAILGSVGCNHAAGYSSGDVAVIIVANAPKVIDILSTKANSRPKARRANGATRKPRNSKPSTGAGLYPSTIPAHI